MTGHRGRSSGDRGFTLVELVIVILVIAILAALIIPTILGQVQRARVSEALETVNEVAKTLKRFHDDSGYWPYGNSVWNPNPNGSPTVAPGPYTVNDTSLFLSVPPTATPPLSPCASVSAGMSCWNGPYLGRGGSMADSGMIDPWGDPLYFTMQRPFDGLGGGSQYAPNGAVVVWSLGPNMLDETGCTSNTGNPNLSGATSAGCSFNLQCVVAGCSSTCTVGSLPACVYSGNPVTDDLVRMAGTAL